MRTAWIVVVLAACEPKPEPPAPAPIASAPIASPSSSAPAPTPTPTPTPAPPPGPPPGDDTLVPVPAAIVSKIALRHVATGFARPVLLVTPPGDPLARLFVVEQRGAIRTIELDADHPDKPGRPNKAAFFTISGLATGGEQGLLGLAFHPQWTENHTLFVDYTTTDKRTHVARYVVPPGDPDHVDLTSGRELFALAHPYSNHNGGNLLFGPDGKLYLGMGDGGSANDPNKNGQNDRAYLAKILRFDVDHLDDDATAKPTPEIVHLGMRNPWRFWFDRPTGDLYIGDVGQNLWEEIDVAAANTGRHNFGWNVMEGTHCFDAESGKTKATCDGTDGFTPPVVEYPHAQGCSVTGGATYRGKALPALDGVYFYADYCTGLLRSFRWTRDARDPAAPNAVGWVRDHWDWKAAIDPNGVLVSPSSFGVDADGELYIVLLGGDIYELVPKA